MSTRVYLPLTSTELAGLVETRSLPGPHEGHAVTEALRAEWDDADEEQWSYAVTQAAAEESWLRRGEGDRPRRHVLVADVSVVEPLVGEVTAVRVPGAIGWPQVAALHVDTSDQSEGAEEELAWFARQEIPELVLRRD